MLIEDFNFFKPSNIEEACRLMDHYGNDAMILAGGTDVLTSLKRKKTTPKYIVSINHIRGLSYVKERDGKLRIGTLTTHRDLERSSLIKEKYQALHDSVKKIGSVQIRNIATIGGNLCSSLPSADTASPLLVLYAELKIQGIQGVRYIKIQDFFLGPGKNALQSSEILTEILLPVPPKNSTGAYIKYGRREAMEIPMVGAAVFLLFDGDNKVCKEARVALTTSADTPIRSPQAELALSGKGITSETLRFAGAQANLDAKPRSSWRASENYRRMLIQAMVYRAGLKALERLEK